MSDLRAALQSVYEQHGRLTPPVLLADARDEHHPLHDRFEWDDSIAGEKYRLQQAHDLISSVKLRYRDTDGKESDIRPFHAVVSPAGGFEYRPAEEIAQDEVLTKLVLRDMERDWNALRSRYTRFSEFVGLVREFVEAEAS